MRSPLQVHRQSGDDEMGRQSASPNTFYSTDPNACSMVKQEMMHNAVNATVVSAAPFPVFIASTLRLGATFFLLLCTFFHAP